ncbi:MAG: helix-turn-helix transcriptional regulator [Clostridia bacterium]
MNIVKKYREAKNISRTDLADKVKISRSMVEAIEQNRRKPSYKVAVKISNFLEIPWEKMNIFLLN